MDNTPMNLYKYLPAARAIDVLETLLIRFSQASVLNDALEFKPNLKGLASRPDLEAVLTKELKSRFPDLLAQVDTMLPSIAEKLKKKVISSGAEQALAQFPQP